MEGSTMVQVLHGEETTTEAVRRAIQNSQESLRGLAKRYGINQKTATKWKKRTFGHGSSYGSQGCEVDGLIYRGRSCRRRLSPTHAVAFGRLLVRAAANSPAPDPIFIAS